MEKKRIQETAFADERFTKHNLFRQNKETVFVLNLKPDQELPPHKHPNRHLYIMGFEGEGQFMIDGDRYDCAAGDTFSIAADEDFGVKNVSDGNFRAYAVMVKQSE